MRVLIVTPWWPTREHPNFAPFMVSDAMLVQELNQVVVVHLVDPSRAEEQSHVPPGFRVVRVPFHFSKPRTWLPAACILRRLSARADIVHTMALTSMIPVTIAKCTKPWVHTEHYSTLVDPEISRRQKVSLWIQRQMYRVPDRLVAVGRSLADVMSQTSGGEVIVVGNHVMIEAKCVRTHGDEIGPGKSVRAISVGGLIDRKGPIEAVDAILKLRERGVDASLRWVGEGSLSEKVGEHARDLGVGDYVELVGPLSRAELQEELRAANLFLLPTQAETFGVAIAEALGYGLPVVVSGVGGHLEFLPEKGCRTVEKRDGITLANAIEDLIADPSRLNSQEIWSYARARFSDEKRRETYLNVYSDALAAHRTATKGGDTVA